MEGLRLLDSKILEGRDHVCFGNPSITQYQVQYLHMLCELSECLLNE